MARSWRAALAALVVVAVFGACASSPGPVADAPEGALTVGVTTPTGAAEAAQDADALASLLAGALGRPVVSRVFAGYEPLVGAIAGGEIDLAWMPPLTFVRANALADVAPLRKATRAGQGTYKAVIFARADRPFGSPADLGGTRMAWVSPTSSSGFLFPSAMLIEAGLRPEKLFARQTFLGDHEAVCRAVLDGSLDAGATFTDDVTAGTPTQVTACRGMGPEAAASLKILTATDPIPNDVIAARPGLPAGTRDAVVRALDSIAGRPDVSRILGSLFHADGFAPVTVEEYAPVKRALLLLEPPKAKD